MFLYNNPLGLGDESDFGLLVDYQHDHYAECDTASDTTVFASSEISSEATDSTTGLNNVTSTYPSITSSSTTIDDGYTNLQTMSYQTGQFEQASTIPYTIDVTDPSSPYSRKQSGKRKQSSELTTNSNSHKKQSTHVEIDLTAAPQMYIGLVCDISNIITTNVRLTRKTSLLNLVSLAVFQERLHTYFADRTSNIAAFNSIEMRNIITEEINMLLFSSKTKMLNGDNVIDQATPLKTSDWIHFTHPCLRKDVTFSVHPSVAHLFENSSHTGNGYRSLGPITSKHDSMFSDDFVVKRLIKSTSAFLKDCQKCDDLFDLCLNAFGRFHKTFDIGSLGIIWKLLYHRQMDMCHTHTHDNINNHDIAPEDIIYSCLDTLLTTDSDVVCEETFENWLCLFLNIATSKIDNGLLQVINDERDYHSPKDDSCNASVLKNLCHISDQHPTSWKMLSSMEVHRGVANQCLKYGLPIRRVSINENRFELAYAGTHPVRFHIWSK